MKGQRMAMFAGLLATTVGLAVAGLAARPYDDGQVTTRRERADRQRDDERRVFVMPDDRQVIRLDGRGSQIGVLVSDPEAAGDPGVTIDRVEADSPAEKAGVKAGDRVVEFDGEKVRSTRQLTRLIQESPAGRAVSMTLLRDGDRRTVDITPDTGRTARNFDWSIGPELEREIERGVERGLRDLPRQVAPFFDFWTPGERFDGIPGLPGMRGRLGVQVQPLNDQLADYFGAKDGGVLVSGVTVDSPASKAGLKAGDVITKVNGEAVKDTADLVEALGEVKDDGAVSLDIVRDKKASSLKATIERTRTTRPTRSGRPA